jgi:phosphoglucomutase
MMVAEAACYYAEQGKTLHEAIIDLYEKYGWYHEVVISNSLYGQEGIAKILQAVEQLRADIPVRIGSFSVCAVRDYQKQVRVDLRTGATTALPMQAMNVLYLELDGGRMIVRPSGTEPKLKSYLSVSATNRQSADRMLEDLQKGAKVLLETLLR